MSHAHEFDRIVVNDAFDATLAQLQAIVHAARAGGAPCQDRHADLLTALLAQA
ncbi:MAG: hypothetical protein KDG53_18010 [Rhodocyclaceae bacterium]|nr:hypothetical protein [Rhodocyclaceae bacterium]